MWPRFTNGRGHFNSALTQHEGGTPAIYNPETTQKDGGRFLEKKAFQSHLMKLANTHDVVCIRRERHNNVAQLMGSANENDVPKITYCAFLC